MYKSFYLHYDFGLNKIEKFVFYFSKVTEMKDVCDTCGYGGHLLCCDSCPLLFHIECVVPPLKKVPRGKWFCPKCKMVKGEKCGVDFINCWNGKWAGKFTEICSPKFYYR